jgi:hypothetical protein
MSAFPTPDLRYGEVLAARQVPRDQWRNYHEWVRFYLHFCLKYRHPPADSTSLELFLGKLASKGQTATRRAQAHCAVKYYAVFWSPAVPSWRDDTRAPTAPTDGVEGLSARKPESAIAPSPAMDPHAHVLVQANGARDRTNAAWRDVPSY